MSHIIETIEDLPIEVPVIIEGVTDNGQMRDVVFSFYSGPAGVRERGHGRIEFAYFRPPPLSRWRPPTGDGTIDGLSYRVLRGKISSITQAMAVIIAEQI